MNSVYLETAAGFVHRPPLHPGPTDGTSAGMEVVMNGKIHIGIGGWTYEP